MINQFWLFKNVVTIVTNCDKQLLFLYNFDQLQIILTIVINRKNFDLFWDLGPILINDNFDMTIVTILKTVNNCDNYDLL